ncbi:DUF2752 domain-containing protein [Flavobacterium ammonificans]|uniref:DUF2752 domain-containing protein n=1 Tax=Flavobacterium ammonificans TaxID=1751056 RepID=A0ABN6KZ53_9FLAO|nr:DUF2752 domain-containing protein [Flavobacterium ammonificans]BDB53589.1 hypothetical protein GENT11_19010 [Flavobacterium ammonificans]
MDIESFMIPCISKTLFGLECLGCGFQRALLLLVQGNYRAAFEMYPAIYSSLILIFFIGLHYIDTKRNYKSVLLTFVTITILFMIGGYYYKHFY